MDIFERLKNLKILLVDDDEWIRDSLSLFFEAEGCNLLAFETAEEGIEAVKQQSYDIVISDYKLPGMDGLSFLNEIEGRQPDTWIILITAYADEVFKKAGRLNIHDFITKPFTSEDIQKSLIRLMKRQKRKN